MSFINVFISYSHADDTLRKRLETHLNLFQRQGVIRMWSDRVIEPGMQFEETILDNLRNADIVLLLISADFLASDFCQYIELKLAMERHHSGQARVIPVFLSSCDWKHAQFGTLQGAPDEQNQSHNGATGTKRSPEYVLQFAKQQRQQWRVEPLGATNQQEIKRFRRL